MSRRKRLAHHSCEKISSSFSDSTSVSISDCCALWLMSTDSGSWSKYNSVSELGGRMIGFCPELMGIISTFLDPKRAMIQYGILDKLM